MPNCLFSLCVRGKSGKPVQMWSNKARYGGSSAKLPAPFQHLQHNDITGDGGVCRRVAMQTDLWLSQRDTWQSHFPELWWVLQYCTEGFKHMKCWQVGEGGWEWGRSGEGREEQSCSGDVTLTHRAEEAQERSIHSFHGHVGLAGCLCTLLWTRLNRGCKHWKFTMISSLPSKLSVIN